MNKRQFTYFLIAAIIFWYYSQKLQAANALTVRYLLPQNVGIRKGAVMWNQPIVITNPTGTPINLNRYNMRVDFENYPVGTAYGNILTTLMAGGDTTIMANVVVPIDALMSAIPSILNAGKALNFRFVGNIVAEFLTIPIDTRIDVPVPKISF